MASCRNRVLGRVLTGSLLGVLAVSVSAETLFDAVYISADPAGNALTPLFDQGEVGSTGTGTYLAPTAIFGTGDLDPFDDHFAYRVATDGQLATPVDLLDNTNTLIGTNPGGGGAGGESIDYEVGNANTNTALVGQGTAVSHATLNAIDNDAINGRRRLVADFEMRGANFFGKARFPAQDHIGWQFLTGNTDMKTAPENLTASLRTNGNASAASANTQTGATSETFAWNFNTNETITIDLASDAAFDAQWNVTSLGFVLVRARATAVPVVFTLSDGSTTTITLTPVAGGQFAEGTAGELAYGEVFVGLDLAGAGDPDLSITGVSFTAALSFDTAVALDDLAIVLTPVPEPGSMGLAMLGLGLIVGPRHRRSK